MTDPRTVVIDCSSESVRQSIVEVLRRKGKPYESGSHYSHTDWRIAEHLTLDCSLAEISERDVILEETTVWQFLSTFDGSEQKVLITGYGFSCTCGKHSEFSLYVEDTFSSVLAQALGWIDLTDSINWSEVLG